jgi:hypothetical protein
VTDIHFGQRELHDQVPRRRKPIHGACGKNIVFFTPPHLIMEFPPWTQRMPHAPPATMAPFGERYNIRVGRDDGGVGKHEIV